MLIHLTRVAAAVFGGYAFTWGFSAIGITFLVAMGIGFHEAETAVLMLAFLVFLAAFLWAFAAATVKKVWIVLMTGAAGMSGAAWLLQHSILG